MNKFNVFGIYMLVCGSACGQTISVKSQSESIEGNKINGYATALEGKKDNVQSAWVRFLKDYGKVRQGDHIIITEPVFNGLNFSKGIIHGLVTDDGGKATTVWLGIKPEDWDSQDVSRVNHELEKVVHQFGVKFYRDKIQLQIDEAQQASDAVEKQKQRLITQNKDLVTRLANNAKQKLDLEKATEQNKVDKTTLESNIIINKKAQDSLLHVGEQVQKVKIAHQERQAKVN